MKMQGIIKAITDAAQFAAALEVIAPIGVQPGTPADVAALTQAAQRLSDQLAAIQRQISREVATLKGSNRATAGRDDADVVDMLIRAQGTAN